MSDLSACGPVTTPADPALGASKQDDRPLAGIPCCMDFPARAFPETDPGDLPSGFVIDERFLIRETIGRSGMATIYLALDLKKGGEVAVKIPHARIESDPVAYGRFQREQRIGASLNHPFLLKFIGTEAEKSRPYLVTEYLDGCTLSSVIHRFRPLQEKDALRIASALCEAVAALHSRGVIHRDLKPDNVMICRDGRLCLMDFGLAEEVGESRGLLGGFVPLFGTPEYMAPEQVRGGRNDERTDIYSLGVILYQMLTAALPFTHEDPWAAAHLRVNGDPVAPRELIPAISEQAEEIVLHAMRRDPDERYPKVGVFKVDVDRPEGVHVTGLCQRLRAPRWRLSLQGTPVLAGTCIGLGALLFMVGLFFFLMRHR